MIFYLSGFNFNDRMIYICMIMINLVIEFSMLNKKRVVRKKSIMLS